MVKSTSPRSIRSNARYQTRFRRDRVLRSSKTRFVSGPTNKSFDRSECKDTSSSTSQTIFLRSSSIFCSRDLRPCHAARVQPARSPLPNPTNVPLRSHAAGQKFRVTHSCMYKLFSYSRLNASNSTSMTKDSPRATSFARRATYSALSRCMSSRSDIERAIDSSR